MTDETNPKTLKFHYIKSPQCRDIHVNGFFGGMNTATGDLRMSIYAERPAIPQIIEHELNESGELGQEIKREGRDGVVRIVQDTLYLDLSTALALHRWLSDHIDNFMKANPNVLVEEKKSVD